MFGEGNLPKFEGCWLSRFLRAWITDQAILSADLIRVNVITRRQCLGFRWDALETFLGRYPAMIGFFIHLSIVLFTSWSFPVDFVYHRLFAIPKNGCESSHWPEYVNAEETWSFNWRWKPGNWAQRVHVVESRDIFRYAWMQNKYHQFMIILISRKVFQNSFRNTFIPQWICLQGNNDFSRNHIINLKLPFEEAFAQTKFFS